MNLLLVSELDRYSRAVRTITKYVEVGKQLGHTVAVFGEQRSELPLVDYSLDLKGFDFVIFVVYQPSDFPDLPYLAQLLDGIPKERRVIIDCCGRYNDTIRVEHDFNHLEKMDGHQGWEWIEGFQAVAETILQPTLRPLRPDVRPFLFHAYDPAAVAVNYTSVAEAAHTWSGVRTGSKPYDIIYVGNNWQRWSQIRALLESLEPIRQKLGRICLVGWDWEKRPDWAVQLGIAGADLDPDLLARLNIETRLAVPFDEVVDFVGQARFCPVIHRPLYNELGIVTNRTFETFCADTMPLLMLPPELVETTYGVNAKPLRLEGDIAAHLEAVTQHPEMYWEAVLQTREYLAARHSYQRRFQELLAILEG
jgi:hypothetical protein